MKKLETIAAMRSDLLPLRRAGKRIGFVPTMGALHEGHQSLIRAARATSDVVVVSIFVNPTQFGPGEDYEKYPRQLPGDLAACQAEGADLVFCPSAEEIYRLGACTTVSVSGVTDGLCGVHRPGHFDGVATVVALLFNIVQPDAAYFGQKDAQQVAVIRRMVRDLAWPIEIVTCPTVREPDGLAMSSRNVYLSPEQRRQAICLYRSLTAAKSHIESGERDVSTLIGTMREMVQQAGPCSIDYIEIVDPETMGPKDRAEGCCLIALAVRIANTRLIDNVLVDAD